MASMDEQILKAAKEIVVKFIETGRLSPTAFPEVFQSIFQTVAQTVRAGGQTDGQAGTVLTEASERIK